MDNEERKAADHAGACYDEHERMVQANIPLNMLVSGNDSLWNLHYCSSFSHALPATPISLERLLQWNDVNGHDTNSMQTCNLPQHNLCLKIAPPPH